MKILLTGFEPFANVTVNPSQLVVEELARRSSPPAGTDLVTEVLPTAYVEAGRRLTHLIRHLRPDRIICLGVAGGDAIRFERVALNLDDADIPDNAGLSRTGNQIVADGPVAYWATLPIGEMRCALRRLGIPAIISNHAGTYLCNHVFYLARHEVECLGLGSASGFIHLPHLLEATARRLSGPGMPLEMMVKAVECCLAVSAGEGPAFGGDN